MEDYYRSSTHRGLVSRRESVAMDSSRNLLVVKQGAVLRTDTSTTNTIAVQSSVVPTCLWGGSKDVAVDSPERVYFADRDTYRLLSIDKYGAITTCSAP